MRAVALLFAAGCSVSTSRFEALEPCRTDAHCPPGYTCSDGLCARCLQGQSCGVPDGGQACSRQSDCDDRDACNGRETCDEGLCVPGEPLDCSAMSDPRICVVGGCADGACIPLIAADGSPCDDGVFCLSGDLCESGVCTGGTAVACDDGDQCTVDVCDEDGDTCTNSVGTEGPLGDPSCGDAVDNDCDGVTDGADPSCLTTCPEGTPCDDGIWCNGADECRSEACVNVGPAPCTPDTLPCTATCDEAARACNVIVATACVIGGNCYSAGTLNPANPCQECVPVASRTGWTNDNSNECVNGLFCDSLDRCEEGTCTGTGLPTCMDDGLTCTTTCDEATDTCNVINPGSCLIGGLCRAAGDRDPANPCQECVPAIDPYGWTTDNTNACSDGISCTDDSCSGGVCVSSPTGSCGPGEICRPACFGGPTGCGVPPGSLTLACSSPEPVGGSSSCSLVLAGGTSLGQTACLSCQAQLGVSVLGRADFEECPASLDGFTASSGSPSCVTLGNRYLEAANAAWTIESSFDTTGLDDLTLCFSYAESGMDTGDTMTVSVCADGTCAAPVVLLADAAGPSLGDTAWHRYCVDVDAHEPLALGNPALLVRIGAVSSGTGHLVQIDDVELRGRRPFCAPETLLHDEDVFTCTGSSCGVVGWTSTAACDIADPCAGTGLTVGTNEMLDVCRGVDFSGAPGDRFLIVDVGENDADDAVAADSWSLQVCDGAPGAGCSCAAGWQTVLGHTGDMDGMATLTIRHLAADLGGLAFSSSTLGVRLLGDASGPGDSVEFDRIRAGVRGYACPSAELTVGPIIEVGGGSYAVSLDSSTGAAAELWCSWDTPFPPVNDNAKIEFLP